MKARKRERVRCSSLIDWPVYPRLAHTMRASNDTQCGADACVRSPRSVARRAEIAMAVEKVIEVTPQGWADRGAGRAARPFSLRQRRERAAKARRNRWVSSERLSHHGIMTKSPSSNILTAARTPVFGMAADPRLLFQAKSLPIPAVHGKTRVVIAYLLASRPGTMHLSRTRRTAFLRHSPARPPAGVGVAAGGSPQDPCHLGAHDRRRRSRPWRP